MQTSLAQFAQLLQPLSYSPIQARPTRRAALTHAIRRRAGRLTGRFPCEGLLRRLGPSAVLSARQFVSADRCCRAIAHPNWHALVWRINATGERLVMRILVALAICLIPANGALACSCKQPTADTLLASSAAIFTGVVLESRPATQGEAVTDFQVVAGYKGVARGQTISVRHRSGLSASCGVKFESGRRYTLTSYREDVGTALFANLCSISVMRSPAGKELLQRMRQQEKDGSTAR
jgi:hypothetical protein